MTVDGEPTTAGRRERKKSATRAAIRDAALRLAVRDGVENVTLDRIAGEADIALRTFFNYFSSKEEAVVAGAAGDFRAFVAAFRARPRGESVLQALREGVLDVMDQMVSDERDHISALVSIRGAPSLVPQLLAALAAQEDAFAEAIAERVDADTAGSLYPRLCAATALATLRITLDRWLEESPPGGVPSFATLRAEIDRGIAELAAGLDRPGAPE
ncbi:TetR/AcrR family transcriptional regulator [Trujillonella endophytica]|uniref:Transcriptional regulator, TetR family n=1 Tax=Trujillonella endophytica TaxID=673521 RepID=A0A1H8SFK9_9ACTN|nr:TetR/AcrR family transcriptional regulator [Trujillella endophytica]SEO77365.1 transcriptional regulator, TetR family [Trujillella endophytica]